MENRCFKQGDDVILVSEYNRNKYTKYLDSLSKPSTIIATGFPDINKQVIHGGFPEATLCYLYAKASVGKTYFISNWIYRLLTNNASSTISVFSLEMSYLGFFNRFLQLILEMNAINSRSYIEKDQDEVTKILESINFFDRVSIHETKMTLENIDKWVEIEKPDWVFVDHLHRVSYKNASIFEKTTAVSNGFVDIKNKHKTRMIALVQLKREGGGGGNRNEKKEAGSKFPMLEDGKGSGAIEEDGDFIIGLKRNSIVYPDDNRIGAAILKNRLDNGDMPSNVYWKYDRETSKLTEWYDEYKY